MLTLVGLNPRDILYLQAGALRQILLGHPPKSAHPRQSITETAHRDTSFRHKV
jgi:hypothetical protein